MSKISKLAQCLNVPEKGLHDLLEKYFDLSLFQPIERKHIFICGGKQHGKSTLANIIVQHDPSGIKIESLADPIKRIGEMFGVNDDDNEDKDTTFVESLKRFKREVYQIIGTEIGRELDENVWIKKLDEKVFMLPKQYHTIVYPDMRFPNELQFSRSLKNAIIVRITRPNYKSSLVNNHKSEQFYNTFVPNYEIINDGSLQDYIEKCKVFVKEICN